MRSQVSFAELGCCGRAPTQQAEQPQSSAGAAGLALAARGLRGILRRCAATRLTRKLLLAETLTEGGTANQRAAVPLLAETFTTGRAV